MKDHVVERVILLSLWAALALACKSPGDAETTATGTTTEVTTTDTGSAPTTGGDATTTTDGTTSGTSNGTGGMTGEPTTGATDTGDTTGGEGGVRPPEPGPMIAPDGDGVVLAISRFFIGNTDRDGTPNQEDGWRQYGYDLDHTISDAGSTDVCLPRAGADPGMVYPDGDDGIDNNFGKLILPILLDISADLGAQQDDTVMDGEYTLLFDLQQLGTGADYNPLLTRHYIGAELGSAPKFDGTDAWPVDPASLVDPADILTPKLALADSYVTGNTWVGVASPDATLTLRIGPLDLQLRHAVITMDLDASHQFVPRGTLAGVLSVVELRDAFKEFAGAFDPGLCEGASLESILTQVEQAADILLGPPQDPTKQCDAISIGIGFEAARVKIGAIAAAVPEQDFCP